MNTMEITKVVGGITGTLLVFLLIKTGVEAIYSTEEDGDEHTAAYVIEIPEVVEATAEVEAPPEVPFADIYATADAAAGEREFRACAACHKLEAGANGVGPTLYSVVMRGIAAESDFEFSPALADKGGIWTPEALDGFLASPAEWAPGTKMTFRGITKPESRANLIAYLATIGG